jgi:signal peptidase I
MHGRGAGEGLSGVRNEDEEARLIARRKPWAAGLLSLVLPGLGHLYAGRPRAAGIAFLLGPLAAATAFGAPLFLRVPPVNVLIGFLALLVYFVGVPLHAARAASAASPSYQLRWYNRWYVYLGLWVVLAFLVQSPSYEYTKAHLVEAFRVPSGSMEPTIRAGDFLYVGKWNATRRNLRHGTVVVFQSVEEPGLKVVKRIVGLPGDTLRMATGTLYRNGQPLTEPYTTRSDPGRSEDPVQRAKMRSWQVDYLVDQAPETYRPDLEEWGPLVVPDGSLFLLGDSRDASYDSRYYGFVPRSNVLGQPRVVYFSYDPRGPGPFLRRVRWGRLGQVLP